MGIQIRWMLEIYFYSKFAGLRFVGTQKQLSVLKFVGIHPRGGGGTLIFYIYISLADFFGVKILKFSIFWVFRKITIFWVVSFLWIFFWGLLINRYFFGVISNFQSIFFLSFLG